MEKNQVLLTLDEYNELRDVKKELEKGNIVGFVVRSCGYRDMCFYTENEVVKQFATENADLLLQLNESEAKLTEFRNNLKLLLDTEAKDPKYCDVIVKRMIKLDDNLNVKRNGVDCTNEFKA